MALSVCQWLLLLLIACRCCTLFIYCLSLLVVGVYCLLFVHWLFVGCSLFIVCSLFVHCSLFVVHCLLFVGCCLSVVGCSFVGLSFSHSLVIQSFIGCLLVYRFTSG